MRAAVSSEALTFAAALGHKLMAVVGKILLHQLFIVVDNAHRG